MTFYTFFVFFGGGYPKNDYLKIELSLRFMKNCQKLKSNYSDVLYPGIAIFHICSQSRLSFILVFEKIISRVSIKTLRERVT